MLAYATHDVRITAELRELPPTADRWRQCEPTGRAHVDCPCGLNTGWTDRASAQQTFASHSGRRST